MPTSYGDLTGATDYHAAHGNAAWSAATSDQQQQALLIASEWIDAQFGDQFAGYPTGKIDQERAWPRTNAYDVYGRVYADDEIPARVAQATYEVALRQVQSAGSLFKDFTPASYIKQLSVDGAVSLTYAGASGLADVQVAIPAVGPILKPLLVDSSAGSAYFGRSVRA